MSRYVYDEQGKWLVQGSIKMLIEPSEEYLAQRDLEEQLRQEEEKNRPLTEEEVMRDYVLDMDFRLIMLELGVMKGVM